MEIVEKDLALEALISKNIPFVIFREPGKQARCVIQNSPLTKNQKREIEERGFYVFPFSSREKSQPLYFAPDYVFDWEVRHSVELKLEKLKVAKAQEIRTFEVNNDSYVEDLTKYLEAFKGGVIKKAIYSRIKVGELETELDLNAFFETLMERYPKAFTYMLNIPGDGLWIGASPELLLSYNKGQAKTVALAGTLKINRNLPAPEWTRKEIDEHRLVEKHIISLCESKQVNFTKSPVRSSSTGKVYHLKSDFFIEIDKGKLSNFLTDLHPTPAISGLPQKESLDLIYETEKHDRSYYCGYLGWVENVDDFNLFINLRCMKLQDKTYILYAGGGITIDSDIKKEWEETEVKMTTLTDLLPNHLN